MATIARLSRKKVMRLASKLWEVNKSGSWERCYNLFLNYYQNTYSDVAIRTLAGKLLLCMSWGEVQSIAWKMAKSL